MYVQNDSVTRFIKPEQTLCQAVPRQTLHKVFDECSSPGALPDHFSASVWRKKRQSFFTVEFRIRLDFRRWGCQAVPARQTGEQKPGVGRGLHSVCQVTPSMWPSS